MESELNFNLSADLDDDEVAESIIALNADETALEIVEAPQSNGKTETSVQSDLFGYTQVDKLPGGAMCQRFIEPPFTALDSKSGRWQDRKRDWQSLGIESEIGRNVRGNNVSGGMNSAFLKDRKPEAISRTVSGKTCTSGENTCMLDGPGAAISLFDPVLCELCYSWFMPAKPSLGIFDPFAGGSVRGIVASRLGYDYTGIDLRQEQIEANNQQAKDIPGKCKPRWICSDSTQVESLVGDEYDLLFTCPPYWNLERYSDDPRDLSTLDNWQDFLVKYQRIMLASARRLKSQRFAVVVVGNIRDDEGFIRDMRGPTASALLGAGFKLYNEFILLTPIGSLPLRVNIQFAGGRKAGSSHQYVMCFFRGNPDSIKKDFTEFS
jgi:hypothetical protein